MVHEQSATTTRQLPTATTVGEVHLKVASLPEALVFYRDILGYTVTSLGDDIVALAPGGGEPHVVLHELAAPEPVSRRTSGLFHAAILLPERRDLALVTQRLVNSGWDIGGASDHGVSEALYLDDQDGNGIEIYVDRPRAQWPVAGNQVRMVAERLDFDNLFGELAGGNHEWQGIPSGTTIGHIHLQVSDLEASRRFYVDLLGFDVMQDTYPGALFVAAGGYHHHLGMNTWAGRGVPRPPENAVGLERFAVNLPDMSSLEVLAERLQRAGADVPEVSDNSVYVRDPDGIEIEIRVAG